MRISRTAVVAALGALASAVILATAPGASAATIGSLTFNGLTSQQVAFSVTTSGACPTTPTLSTNFLIKVAGGNLPATPTFITGNTAGSTVGSITDAPFTANAQFILETYAANNGLTKLGDGTYTVTLVCRQAIQGASLGDFVGQFTVSNNGATVTPVTAPPSTIATTTAITSASPAAGTTTTPATFTASVTQASGTTPPAGTVQFKVDGANLGSPVTVLNGNATSVATGLLTAGPHSIVASFTGATGWGASTSAPFTYTVAATPPSTIATTTAITTASPAAGSTATPATFTATVTQASGTTKPAGTVQFKVDGANLGSPVTVANGAATSPATGLLTAGPHAILASFTGATGWGASTSAPFTYTVTGTPPPGPVKTTTNLTLSAATVTVPGTITGTAVVTAGSTPITSGTVTFYLDDADKPFGFDATGADSFSFAPLALKAGKHTIKAKWSGATIASIVYEASCSPAAPVTAVVGYAPDVQSVQFSVASGTLQISTPYTAQNPLVLPTMSLNPTLTEFSTSAPFAGITVGDGRQSNLGWTVSAISSAFTKFGVGTPGPNEQVNAQNIGLTGITLTGTSAIPATFLGGVPLGGSTAGQNLTAFDNPAAAHLASGAPGNLGLGGTPKSILHANTGKGTTVVSGLLTVTAPTSTADGVYAGTITFTIIGS
jgi:hypothetical protein